MFTHKRILSTFLLCILAGVPGPLQATKVKKKTPPKQLMAMPHLPITIAKPSPWLKISRWWHPGARDWVDIQMHPNTPYKMRNAGYSRIHKPLYSLRKQKSQQMHVAVYRWWHPKRGDWLTVPSSGPGFIHPKKLKAMGYHSPHFLGYASDKAVKGGCAVYRWWHPKDKDWVSIPSSGMGHIPGKTLQNWGYQKKTLMFYARK